MPLTPEQIAMDEADIARSICPECRMHLAGVCVCGRFNPQGHAFCGGCGKPLDGKPKSTDLLKHAQEHWESEEKAAAISPHALKRWKMVTGHKA
jgi:hypothetical protein